MASVAVKMGKIKAQVKALNEMKTKGDAKNTLIKTGAEMILSVLVGGGLGSLIGRPSFAIGLGLAGIANYTGHTWATPIGLGMMATSTFGTKQKTVGALDLRGQMENAKERLVGFKDSLMHRTYLDKVFKGSGGSDETTKGIGTVDESNETLKSIERQLENSANEFNRSNGGTTSGLEDEIHGMNEPDFSGM